MARFSPDRTFLIARNTVLEAVRQRFVALLVIVALGLVVGSQFLRDFNFGSTELKFIADFGFGALTFFGSILAIVASAQLFFSEIENRTVLTILARPVLRSEFIVGKLLGLAIILLWFTLLVTGTLLVVLWVREGALLAAIEAEGRIIDLWAVAINGGVQWLKFTLIAAITIFIASYASTQLFTVGASFVVLVLCHLQYIAQDAWAHADSYLARLAAGFIGLVFPNFQLFNLGDRLAMGSTLPIGVVATAAGYALIYIVVAQVLAVFSFGRREI